jgi:6-pyruvoyltetrahydropterin/6-carboxytetrahydropterin synthase
MRISIFRKAHFNAAHRLHVDSWSDEKNREVFGKCNNPYYHGHNYELEVRLTGELDPESGMLINLDDLKEIIRTEVEDYLDHKNLNEEISEFKTLNPTAENICIVIYNRLRAKLDRELDLMVRLYETPRNFIEYPA